MMTRCLKAARRSMIVATLLIVPNAAFAQNSVVPGVTNVPGAAAPGETKADSARRESIDPLRDPIGWVSQSTMRQVVVGAATGFVILVVMAGIFATRRRPDEMEDGASASVTEGEEDYKGPADTFRPGASAYVEGAKLPPAKLPPLMDDPQGAAESPLAAASRKPAAVIEMQDSRQIPLNKNFASIGRSTVNDIVLTDDNVSREHCNLIVNGDGAWEIVNRTWARSGPEGGMNPIEVNGVAIRERHILKSGDVVRLGNVGHTRFTFRTA